MRNFLVHLCLALSGFAALLYETAWTGEFTFVFGTSKLAVATVLAAYMAGLAIGAGLSARLASRIRRPVLAYGFLELGIALAALAVPFLIRLGMRVFVAMFGGLAELPDSGAASQTVFFLVAAFLILLVPTALMGATLPLLARHAVKSEEELGARVGSLYAVNTLGAVAGTLFTAFVLVPRLGLSATVWVGAGVNGLVFAAAAALSWGSGPLPVSVARGGHAKSGASPGRWILPAILLSGVASFTYEVLWTRLLGHVLGGSVYAFATMLATFLLGIALGSAVASRFAGDRERAVRGFALSQVGIAVASLLAFSLLDRIPELAMRLGTGRGTELLANGSVAACGLLPGALFIGATFPFAVRILARDERDAANASGRVFAWNTVGAIAGAIGAGFVFVPELGYAGTMAGAASVNLTLSAIALLAGGGRRWLVASAVGVAVFFLLRPATPWAVLRSSALARVPAGGDVVYYRVGRTTTVLLLDEGGSWVLNTDGLPESEIPVTGPHAGQMRTTRWMAAMPVLARPETRSMLMIGLGGGMALEAVPGSVESIDVVELEPAVVEANRALSGKRVRDPLADPRVKVCVNDARGAMLITDKRYDSIVSQPSHPWTAGASHLYTREFFEIVRERLEPGGVFVQWMGLPFVDQELFRTLVATLLTVFPEVRVYHPAVGTALFVASDEPISVERTSPEAIANNREDMLRVGVLTPEDVAIRLVIDEEEARRLAAGAQITTDRHNLLQSRSPLVEKRPLGEEAFFEDWNPVPELPGLNATYMVSWLLRRGWARRAKPIAEAALDPVDRELAKAQILIAQRHEKAALAAIERALAHDSESHQALFQLERMRAFFPGLMSDVPSVLERVPDPGRAVLEVWLREISGTTRGLERIDDRLASNDPYAPGYLAAIQMRVQWRLDSGGRERGAEARALIDRLITAHVRGILLSRARASALLDEPRAVLSDLKGFAARLRRDERAAGAKAALELIDALPEGSVDEEYRADVRDMFTPNPKTARAVLEPTE